MRVKNQNERADEIAVEYCDPETCERCNPPIPPAIAWKLMEAAENMLYIARNHLETDWDRTQWFKLQDAIAEAKNES